MKYPIKKPVIRHKLFGPIVATIIGLAGASLLIATHAATPTAGLEAEAGTKTGNVVTILDPAASQGSAVKFGSTPSSSRSCPPLPAYPDENCTGVLPGVPRTTFAANRTITQNGMVIENVNVNGWLIIDADNVIIRNMYLSSSDYWPLRINGSNVLIEDSTLIGGQNTQATLAGTFHARRVNVSGSGDGITLGNDAILEDSYVHDLGAFEGAHNDGINADGKLRTQVIHNTVFNQIGQTSAMFVGNTAEPTETIVRNNLFAGGGYTIYAGRGNGVGHGIVFENNVFSRRFFPNSGFYGPVAYWQNSNGNIWNNNRFEDGTIINP